MATINLTNKNMKKGFLFIILLFGFGSIYAQQANEVFSLINNIEHRDSVMKDCGKKELLDLLQVQNKDYHSLTEFLRKELQSFSEENQLLKDELHKYFILTCPDTLVFQQDFTKIGDVPLCLKERVQIIKAIINLQNKITKIENTAIGLERTLGTSQVAYAAIREKIERDLDEIQSLIHEIKEMNLNTLSSEQLKYFRPGLTDRYNRFKKYF